MSPAADDNLLGASLLLVDDDVGTIRSLRQMLSAYPDLRFATSGTEALRLAAERVPDLILLDFEMPDLRGVEVFQRLKADAYTATASVIFLTAHASGELEASTLDQGAADFLGKPVSSLQVNARVRAQLRLRQLANSQRELTERLELALDAGRLGAWEWALESDRMIWHRSMQMLRGETAPRVRRFADHVAGLDQSDQQNIRQAFEQSLGGRVAASVEYWFQLGNDRRRVRSSMSPVRDAAGQLSRLVGVDQDITEAHRANALLNGANRQLEQFVYFASHDLQAPARQAGSFAELAAARLAEGQVDRASALIDKVIASSQRQQEQIQSFLDLARHRLAEPGEWQHIEMSRIAQQIVSELAELIEARKTPVEVQPMGRCYVPTNLVAHIWRNLIANAIRHQKSDDPRVLVGQRADGDGITYFVEDRGAQSSMPANLINEAEHLEDSSTPKSGLGLQICRRILRVLGGRLWDESVEPNGMRMCFTLGESKSAK